MVARRDQSGEATWQAGARRIAELVPSQRPRRPVDAGPGLSASDLAVLTRAPVFFDVLPVDVEALLPHFRYLEVRRGQALFCQGDDGPAEMFVVLQGRITVSRTRPGVGETITAVLGPGDMLGELAVFDPGPRVSTARAVTRARVAALDGDDLLAWGTVRPYVAARLLRALARRLRRTDDALSDLAFVDVPGRVARALLDLSGRFGVPGRDGTVLVEHGLTQQQLAQLIDAGRETVNKVLADFTDRGWVRPGRRQAITLLRPERLRQRARLSYQVLPPARTFEAPVAPADAETCGVGNRPWADAGVRL